MKTFLLIRCRIFLSHSHQTKNSTNATAKISGNVYPEIDTVDKIFKVLFLVTYFRNSK